MKKRSLSDCQHVTESFLIENMDEMIAAAREGRLLIMPKEHKQPKREDVLNSVRAYVSEIECFARRGGKDSYSNNISKSALHDRYEMWSEEDKLLYKSLKDALIFE